MASEPRSLSRTATIGVAWLMTQTVSVRILSMLSQFILIWLLSPSDFGAVGLANTVAALSATVMNFGIDEVLLQRPQGISRWAASAFWMSMVFAVITMGLILIASPWISRMYGTPELTGLLTVQAIALPIWALATVPYVQARAQLKFRLQAIYNTSELAASQVMTILLAWAGFGAYSFVLPLPVLAVAKAIVFWRKSPISLTIGIRAFRLIHLAVNGLTVFGTRALNELIQQGGYIVLGLTASNAVVGLYYFAYRLAAQPVRLMALSFHYVLFPTLSQIRTDPQRQNESALQAARVLTAIVMPLGFLQAALSDPALRLISSPQWHGSIILVQILSIGLPFDAASWIANALINARGEFRLSAIYTGVSAAMFLVFAAVGAVVGTDVGVSIAVSVYYIVQGPTYSMVIFGRSVSLWGLLGEIYGLPTLISAISVGSAYALSFAPILQGWQIPRILVIGLVAVPLYVVIFWRVRPELSGQISQRLGGEWIKRLAMRRLPRV